jgi:nucleotide-binding universal stress UspA family protein
MDKLLVPVDGSDCSLHALDVAAELARQLDAMLLVCHVVDLGKAAAMSGAEPELLDGCYEVLQDEGKRIVADAAKRVGITAPVSTVIVQGAAVAEIHRLTAEMSLRFVVIGSHGRTGIKRALLGSVAEGVTRGSAVPVIVVPAPKRLKDRAAAASDALGAKSAL